MTLDKAPWNDLNNGSKHAMSEPHNTTLTLRVNGDERTVAFPTHHTLLEVLREECGLTGTKHGCELGECGTCAVLVDGKARYFPAWCWPPKWPEAARSRP